MLGPMDHAKVGARIRAARERLKLTQVQLAAKTGVTQGSLSRIEKGLMPLSLERATVLSKALRLPLAELTARTITSGEAA